MNGTCTSGVKDANNANARAAREKVKIEQNRLRAVIISNCRLNVASPRASGALLLRGLAYR
jgi:hypothetical protein